MNEKDMKELNTKAEEIIEVLGELPYFEQCLILEMCRDSLRMLWMANVAKEGGR